jgi:hypothetical protein
MIVLMNTQSVLDILIALAVVGWVIYRQLTWQVVRIGRLWRMPIILAIVGIIMLAQGKALTGIQPIDLAILVGELLIAVALGAAMGSMAKFRVRPQQASDVTSRRGDVGSFDPSTTVTESRTGGLGAALWIVLILVRVGIEIAVSHYFTSPLLESTGTILFVVAANRAARAFVVANRMERKGLVNA